MKIPLPYLFHIWQSFKIQSLAQDNDFYYKDNLNIYIPNYLFLNKYPELSQEKFGKARLHNSSVETQHNCIVIRKMRFGYFSDVLRAKYDKTKK
jgi:hypothetical protein